LERGWWMYGVILGKVLEDKTTELGTGLRGY